MQSRKIGKTFNTIELFAQIGKMIELLAQLKGEQQPGARPTVARFPPYPVLIINLTSDWRLFVLGEHLTGPHCVPRSCFCIDCLASTLFCIDLGALHHTINAENNHILMISHFPELAP